MVVENMGLDHVAIKVRDIEESVAFYRDVMDMAVSDWIGTDVCFLRTPGDAEDSQHHEMNLTQYSEDELDALAERDEREIDLRDFEADLPEGGPPMLPATGPLYHIAFEVPDYEAILDAKAALEDRDHPIYRGPGRHGPGNNFFLYFPDPDAYPIELTARMEETPEEGGRGARRWPQEPKTWNVYHGTEEF